MSRIRWEKVERDRWRCAVRAYRATVWRERQGWVPEVIAPNGERYTIGAFTFKTEAMAWAEAVITRADPVKEQWLHY